jgi:hypothetical protein
VHCTRAIAARGYQGIAEQRTGGWNARQRVVGACYEAVFVLQAHFKHRHAAIKRSLMQNALTLLYLRLQPCLLVNHPPAREA